MGAEVEEEPLIGTESLKYENITYKKKIIIIINILSWFCLSPVCLRSGSITFMFCAERGQFWHVRTDCTRRGEAWAEVSAVHEVICDARQVGQIRGHIDFRHLPQIWHVEIILCSLRK